MKSGILLLNKPTGISSARVLTPLKRTFSGRRIGHTGTLDPFAQGLLVVLVGSATKLSRWFLKLDKTYRAELTLGAETDTLDLEGTVVAEAPVPEIATLQAAASRFRGPIMQIPPAYSALKVDGRRAYHRARNGETVDIPARPVHVYELSLTPGDRDNRVEMITHCSSGTYIRALARDISASAGSRGHCSALIRTSVGPFSLQEAVSPTDIAEADNPDTQLIAPVDAMKRLGVMPIVTAKPDVVRSLRHGKDIAPCIERLSVPSELPNEIMVVDDTGGDAVAILSYSDQAWNYRVVFPEAG